MARLLSRILIVCMPFVVLLGGTAWVDPFNYFGSPGPVPLELREHNLRNEGATMPFNTMLWKLIAFRRDPAPNVIIGDSRITRLDVGLVSELTGRPLFHFGVPGGNTVSMFRTFWYVDSLIDLHTVYLQVAFRNWSDAVDHDIFEEAHWASSSALYHLSNRGVLQAAWVDVRTQYLGMDTVYDQLPPDQWEIVMDAEREVYANYAYSRKFDEELDRIAAHCRSKGIRLVLIEMPTHEDLHALADAMGMQEAMQRYREKMYGMPTYYDMSGPSALTADRQAYRDPVHPTKPLIDRMVREVWQGPLVNGSVHGEALPGALQR